MAAGPYSSTIPNRANWEVRELPFLETMPCNGGGVGQVCIVEYMATGRWCRMPSSRGIYSKTASSPTPSPSTTCRALPSNTTSTATRSYHAHDAGGPVLLIDREEGLQLRVELGLVNVAAHVFLLIRKIPNLILIVLERHMLKPAQRE